RIGGQGQDVLHAVPAARTIRVEEKRRLIVAHVRREGLEIVDLGAEVAADAALDVRVDLPGRDRCAGEETDEQGSNRREGEARAEMSHEVPPLDSETRAILVPTSHTRESGNRFNYTRTRRLRWTAGRRRGRAFARWTFGIARDPPRVPETWLAVRATVRPRLSMVATGMPAERPARLIAASGRPSAPRIGLPMQTIPS